MDDEDEIDVLGEFTFNSCLSRNDQGIPPCSDLLHCGDSVHPQWLVDSASTANWYDSVTGSSSRSKLRPSGSTSSDDYVPYSNPGTVWTEEERKLLDIEMTKHGRNVRKIACSLTTKTEAEIQALIDAEHGVHLDSNDDIVLSSVIDTNIPNIANEEVIASEPVQNVDIIFENSSDNVLNVKNKLKSKFFKRKGLHSKKSLLKPDALAPSKEENVELIYEDDFMLGSSVMIEDVENVKTENFLLAENTKSNIRTPPKSKKLGNHRRKLDLEKSKFNIKVKMKTHKKRAGNVDEKLLDIVSTPRKQLQIVTGSGQALPLCEGEEVIKISKKKDVSESDSDIDIDVDSDDDSNKNRPRQDRSYENKMSEDKSKEEDVHSSDENLTNSINSNNIRVKNQHVTTASVSNPIINEYERKRQRKIKLQDGQGGYTIMHTVAGDIYQVSSEPRKEKIPKKVPIELLECKVYNSEKPAPFEVVLHVSALLSMDMHAHCSRAEVMGLCGGHLVRPDVELAQPAAERAQHAAERAVPRLVLTSYRPCRAAADGTHCSMCPVSQCEAAEALARGGARVAGWHHSHPRFPARPSRTDLATQAQLQRALHSARHPFVAVITSQHWPRGRTASTYRCVRVESEGEGEEVGYRLRARLHADLGARDVPALLAQLGDIAHAERDERYAVRARLDVCPDAALTYLDKCLSSASHHLRSAGYADDDPVVQQTLLGIRDIFR